MQTIFTWLAVAVIGTLGLLLFLIGVAGGVQMVVLLWRGRRATATVVGDTNPVVNPQFSFTDDNGQTHIVSKAVSSLDRTYSAGGQVTLVYLPDRPETFVVDRFGDKWGVPLLFFLLGVILLLPCLAVAFGPPWFMFTRTFASLAFMTFGVASLTLGFIVTLRAIRFQQQASKALAIITESKRRGIDFAPEEGRKLLTELPAVEPGEAEPWIISVEFTDLPGTKRQGTAEVSKASGRRIYEVGDQVPILYDPDRPWDIRMDTSLNWFGPLLLVIFGCAFLAAGLLLWSGAIPLK